MANSTVIILMLAGLILTTYGCSGKIQQQAPDVSDKSDSPEKLETLDQNQALTLSASTLLHVTLSSTIQTNVNQDGDHFSGTLAASVEANGTTVIPKGARVNLVITKLVKGGTLKTPPEIAFTIAGITMPDGNEVAVKSSQISERGRSHTNREIGMVGGGAAAGAVVGSLLGKSKGAIVGGLAGAAAGTGAAAATGRQNLVFASGKTVTFILEQPLSVTRAAK